MQSLSLANHNRTKTEFNMAIQDYINLIGSEVTFLDKSVYPHIKRTGIFQGISILSTDLKELEFYLDDITYRLPETEFI